MTVQAGSRGHSPDPASTPHLLVAVKTHRATSAEDAEIWRGGADVAPTLTAKKRDYHDGQTQMLAFTCKDFGGDAGLVAPTLRGMGFTESHANGGGQAAVLVDDAVRRFTPLECERLQGEPDNHTQIPWHGRPAEEYPDGPRYRAIGNSWAVPCAAWIGARIARYVYAHSTLTDGLPMPDHTLLPPPHCCVSEFEGRILIHSPDGVVFFESSPDGYDQTNGRPIWLSEASKHLAWQRAVALVDVITKYHNTLGTA
jgi:hypothetical protein